MAIFNTFLTEEIVMDIFNRLPAKCVGRGRCVSKSWRALLSQPCFINTKTKCKQQSLILLSTTGSLFTVPLTFRHGNLSDEIVEPLKKLSFVGHPDSWEYIFGDCDGLVLLQNKTGNVFVANPVTREIRQVPPLPFGPNIHDCFNKYGIGYDSVNNDYKIVMLSYDKYASWKDPWGLFHQDDYVYRELFVNVFSMKNGIWNAAKSPPYVIEIDAPIPGVFVNGYMHWIAKDGEDDFIAAFDVVTETFTSVPPPHSWDVSFWTDVMELGGNLCLDIEYLGNDLWIMKEYGNKDSWIHVKCKKVHNECDELPPRALCLLGEEQMLFAKDETKFVNYNLEKDIVKNVVIHGSSDDVEVQEIFNDLQKWGNKDESRFCRRTFMESLVSPHWSPTTN